MGSLMNSQKYYEQSQDVNPRTSLTKAVSTRDIETVRNLLETGINPSQIDDCDETPLGLAVLMDNLEIVELLLLSSAKVDYGGDIPPLCEAVSRNNICIASKLIEFGANVNIGTAGGYTPLMIAARFGYIESAKLLVEAGADVNIIDDSKTALAIAAEYGEKEVFDYLYPITSIEDAYPESVIELGIREKIINCIKNEDIENLKKMIGYENHLKDYIIDDDGLNILMLAASLGKIEIVKYLIEIGADPNSTATVRFPLMVAINNGHQQVVDFLQPFTSDALIQLTKQTPKSLEDLI
jgi:ankyrin repeat protein